MFQGLARKGLLWAIRAYQRFISPHKGFACAYRVHTGRRSCSHLGFRAVRRHGAWAGLALLRLRTQACGEAFRRCRQAAPDASYRRLQRGSCDLPCDLPCDGVGCDGVGCDGPHLNAWRWGDLCQCCDCSWDRSKRKKPKEPKEQ